MELRDHLLRMVDYEEHSNGLWLTFLDSASSKPNGSQLVAAAEGLFGHICGCYKVWFDRLEEKESDTSEDIREALGIQYIRMRTFIKACPLDKVLTLTEPPYGTWAWSTSDIMFHALSHGNYHRGHIRSLAETHGLSDWPDTDWELFAGKQIAE